MSGRLDGPFSRFLNPGEHVVALVAVGVSARGLPLGFTHVDVAFLDERGRRRAVGGRLSAEGVAGGMTVAATADRLLVTASPDASDAVVLPFARVRTDAAWTPGQSIWGQEFERRPGQLDVTIDTPHGAWAFVVHGIERRHAQVLAQRLGTSLRWTTTSSGTEPKSEQAVERLGLLLVAVILSWMGAGIASLAASTALPHLPGDWAAPAVFLAPAAALVFDRLARALAAWRAGTPTNAAPRWVDPVGRIVLWAIAWTLAYALGRAILY